MPRNVKESDDEWDTRGGRKMRMVPGSSSVLDSPLRRSTRIKQPAAQNDSSPESNGDVVIVGVTKSTRRRTIGLDGAIPETTRSLRVRRNSAASDASELGESDSQAESSGKRITRRTIASLPSVETPSKLRGRAGRVTRAGSESKSTPPVGRITRRTRASSMELEMTDQTRMQEMETPMKSRKRASALPSEPALAEESDDSRMEKTVFEVDEDESGTLYDARSPRGSKHDASEGDEKMDVDEDPVVESEIDTASQKSFDDIIEERASVANVRTVHEDLMEISESSRDEAHRDVQSPQRRIVPSPEKAATAAIERLSQKSPEFDETGASNKENEASNASGDSPSKSIPRTNAETISSPRKSLDSSFSKIMEKRGSISLVEDPPEVNRESIQVAKSEEIVAIEAPTKKDYSLDAKCVVVIEPMDVEKMAVSKTDSANIPPTRQTPNVEEEKDSELIVEIENNADTRKQVSTTATSIIPEATLDETENPKSEEEQCDDLQLVEIPEPKELADSSESPEEVPTEEVITEEKRSSNLTSAESMILESTMEEEKSKNSQGNDEVAMPDENTSTIPPAGVDPPHNKDPVESDQGESVSCETTIPAIETIISEATEVAGISSKSEEETTLGSPGTEATANRRASTDGKSPRTSEDNRDEIICETLKDRKSSIVAESPSSGMNAEESPRLNEETEGADESLSGGISTKEREQRDKGGKSEDEKLEIFSDDPKPPNETDDESEIAGWAAFKELPGSEWVILEKNGEPKKSEETSRKSRNGEDDDDDEDDDAADSIHSYSTERNESECEIGVGKDNWQTTKITLKNRDNGNYDSDDTVIASNEKKLKNDGGERMDGEEPSNDETPMDVANDRVETDEQKKIEVSPKKRGSSNNSKFRDESENSPEKTEKDSSLVSKRETPTNLENEPSDDSTNPEVNSSERIVLKTPKRRSSRATRQSCDSGENENNQTPETPLRASKKSLDASNSKKRKSLDKTDSKHGEGTFDKVNSDSDGAENRSADSNGVDVSRRVSQKFHRKSPKTPNASKIEDESSDSEGESESPRKFNRSSKSEKFSTSRNNSKTEEDEADDDDAVAESTESSASKSKRRSLKKRNESKNRQEKSDEESDSRSKLSASVKSEKRRKSGISENNSRLHGESSEEEMENSQLGGLSSLRNDRRSKSDKDRSMVEMIDSDSNASRDSDDAKTSMQKIPRFLFDANTSSDDDDDEEEPENSIDSDVANDLNLAGKSVVAYSDDDVPGDDCMVTESESYDSDDDDGADLNDFVVNDDEYESEEDEESDEDENESEEAGRAKEKKRKRIISKPGNVSDTSESAEGADRDSDEKESESMETSVMNVESSAVEHSPKDRKEEQAESSNESSIDPRTFESDEEVSQPAGVSFNRLDESNETPGKKPNDTIVASEKIVNLNESGKVSAMKTRRLLPQCSTPRLTPRRDVSLEKSTPAESRKTAKLETSKPDASRKSILFASLKDAKTPKAGKSLLHTSLPTGERTILSELKSPRLTTLHRTMAEPTVDSPDVKFLMKEKLNESLPALKLQQRARESRRSLADNVLEEKIEEDEEVGENYETIENVSTRMEIIEAELVHPEKKKKKKKKKKKNEQAEEPEVDGARDNCIEATREESTVTLESQEAPTEEIAVKKSKKSKKNKEISKTVEVEERSVHEMEQVPSKKKKKKKQKQWVEEPVVEEPIVEEIQIKKKKKKNQEAKIEREVDLEETVEHKEKKKKKKKKVCIVEPEVTTSKKERIPISTEIESFESRSSEKQPSLSKASKKSKTEESSSRCEREQKSRNLASVESTEKLKMKRLPDEFLESLTEVAERPQKRRKIVKDDKPLPSRRMLSPRGETLKDVQVNDNFVSLSASGGTTQFGIVDLARTTKKSKKSVAVKTFRERMLARNPRQPISAYLMYQQKRKAFDKE